MKLGINAMSTIGQMREDFEGIIHALEKEGCAFLEPCGDWGASRELLDICEAQAGKSYWDAENMEKRLAYMKTAGMNIPGMFVFDQVLEEQADQMGEYFQKNGIQYAVVNVPGFSDLDAVYEHIALLKRVAKKLQPYHVQLVKHNHEYELKKVKDRDGKEKFILDIFTEQCTPEELMLEIDTGWLVYMGIDPAEFIRERLNRIECIHLKDICSDYKSRDREMISVACGHGIVDFKGIFEAVPAEKREKIFFMLDQDSSEGDIMEDLLESLRYFNRLV